MGQRRFDLAAWTDRDRLVERATSVVNRSLGTAWRFHPKRSWTCPVCNNTTAFAPTLGRGGTRWHARCPFCGSNERHRLAAHAISDVIGPAMTEAAPRVLHVAPEAAIGAELASFASSYETGDLLMRGVDHRIDLTQLPFPDASFDLVWASHVLEIIRDDRAAMSEIRRVLRPGGLAVLPVPILGDTTIDYPESVLSEYGNWHAPGWDYDQRLGEYFDRIDWFRSEDAPDTSQTMVYEDRSSWPSPTYPYRRATPGDRHSDGIPLCWVDPV